MWDVAGKEQSHCETNIRDAAHLSQKKIKPRNVLLWKAESKFYRSINDSSVVCNIVIM